MAATKMSFTAGLRLAAMLAVAAFMTMTEAFVPMHPVTRSTAPKTKGIIRSETGQRKKSYLTGSTPLFGENRINGSSDSYQQSMEVDANDGKDPVVTNNKLDVILSKLTSAFPLFVLAAAAIGRFQPSVLLWTNRGSLITIMLASVMCGTGLTLEPKDFQKVLDSNAVAVPVGVLCQFLIMPLSAYLVGKTLLLPASPALFLGLCLVGCSPGGTASNLVSLIANADVALSVLLTSCSTILAAVVTPLLVRTCVGSTVSVSATALCAATAKVVLGPVMAGMIVNRYFPKLSQRVSRFTPFASVLLVSLICGGVVAKNSGQALPLKLLTAVFGLHSLGFLAGYCVPRFVLGFPKRSSRTISIETGMQNSALAVVLARSIGADPLASLPGALSATVHSCLGSILAAMWRGSGGEDEDGSDSSNTRNSLSSGMSSDRSMAPVKPVPGKESPDDYPELMI